MSESNVCGAASCALLTALCFSMAVPKDVVLPNEQALRDWHHKVIDSGRLVELPAGTKLRDGRALAAIPMPGIHIRLIHNAESS